MATNWLRRGVPEIAVQKMMGHESLTMTSRYVHLNADDLRGYQDTLVHSNGNGQKIGTAAMGITETESIERW